MWSRILFELFVGKKVVKMLDKVPFVVILGSTGTGKTKLSIELAQRFGGEILSADSMQVYKGLDIVTAKATKEEQAQAKHHLLDVVTADAPYTVLQFQQDAVPIIDDLLYQRNKIPIMVGGTNYYIESVLWKVLVGSSIKNDNSRRKMVDSNDEDVDDDGNNKTINMKKIKLENCAKDCDYNSPSTSASNIAKSANDKKQSEVVVNVPIDLENESAADIESKAEENKSDLHDGVVDLADVLSLSATELKKLPSPLLHKHLKAVDPMSASRLHPNDKRKIVRAFEVFLDSGDTLSSKLEEQRNLPGGCDLGGPLRYSNVIIFWLKCEQETLNARLDARVDAMVAQGLLHEIRTFHDTYVKPYEHTNLQEGVLQSIGFKEFMPYLQKYDKCQDELIIKYTETETGDIPEGLKDLKSCLDGLKLVTRRYSKRQMKWIKNRFLMLSSREVPSLYELNTTDVSAWTENVFLPAENIIQSFIDNKECNVQPIMKTPDPREGLNKAVTNFCEDCNKYFVGEYQWNIHRKSNRHKKAVARKFKNKRKVE